MTERQRGEGGQEERSGQMERRRRGNGGRQMEVEGVGYVNGQCGWKYPMSNCFFFYLNKKHV